MYTVDPLVPYTFGGGVAKGGGAGEAGTWVAGTVGAAVGIGLGEVVVRAGAGDCDEVDSPDPVGEVEPFRGVGPAKPTCPDGDGLRSPEAEGAWDASLDSRNAAKTTERAPTASDPTSQGPRRKGTIKLGLA
jgi:hypothetical protein